MIGEKNKISAPKTTKSVKERLLARANKR
jgi:hypothetical protein